MSVIRFVAGLFYVLWGMAALFEWVTPSAPLVAGAALMAFGFTMWDNL